MSRLRCTQKLLTQLPLGDSPADSAGADEGLGHWHAHLLTLARRKCVLLVHDDSRYCLLLPGLKKADFARLPELFRQHLAADLKQRGQAPALIARVLEDYADLECSPGTDRSVLGRVNEVAQHLEWRVRDVGRLPEGESELYGVSLWLNRMPCRAKGIKGYLIPDQLLQERLLSLPAPARR